MLMPGRFLLFALASVATGGSVQAESPDWRNVETVQGFRGWRQELQRLANEYGKVPVNHFCIVVRIDNDEDGGDNKAFVYWREGKSIQAYGASDYDMSSATSSGSDYTDLRHDVVRDGSRINGSTTRVTRSYVRSIVNNCNRIGTRTTITRRHHRGAWR